MIKPFVIWPGEREEENKAVGEFVCYGIWGRPNALTEYFSMAVVEDGQIIAGTLFHNWYPKEGVIELSSFSKNRKWLTKETIQCMFETPLVRLGCQLVVLRVSERNANMIGIARKFGFTELFIPRLRGRDEGEFIFSFTDDQWKASQYNSAVARQV